MPYHSQRRKRAYFKNYYVNNSEKKTTAVPFLKGTCNMCDSSSCQHTLLLHSPLPPQNLWSGEGLWFSQEKKNQLYSLDLGSCTKTATQSTERWIRQACTPHLHNYCLRLLCWSGRKQKAHTIHMAIFSQLTPIHVYMYICRSVGIQSKHERGLSCRSFPWKHMGR